MVVIIRVPGVLSAPAYRSKLDTITPALHRITPAQSPQNVGDEIVSIPTDVGNSISVINPPVMRAVSGFTYAAFRGTSGGEDDTIRLAASPTISLETYTTMVVARFVNVALGSGNTSLFYMMPPGGGNQDLTLLAPSGSRVLRYSASGVQVNHTWTPNANWHIFSLTKTATAVTIGVDGVEVFSEVTAPASNGFSIGSNRGGGNPTVDVADVAIFPALTLSQRQAEEANFAAFYGLTLP